MFNGVLSDWCDYNYEGGGEHFLIVFSVIVVVITMRGGGHCLMVFSVIGVGITMTPLYLKFTKHLR